MLADRCCSVNCEPGNEGPGFAIGTARAIVKYRGLKGPLRADRPGTSAPLDRQGLAATVVGAYPPEIEGFIRPVSPISYGRDVFLTRKDSTREWSGVAPLTSVTLGVVREQLQR